MAVKEELRHLVDTLSDIEAADLLEYARWLGQPSETLTVEELACVREGEEQIWRGECITLDALKRDLGLDGLSRAVGRLADGPACCVG